MEMLKGNSLTCDPQGTPDVTYISWDIELRTITILGRGKIGEKGRVVLPAQTAEIYFYENVIVSFFFVALFHSIIWRENA